MKKVTILLLSLIFISFSLVSAIEENVRINGIVLNHLGQTMEGAKVMYSGGKEIITDGSGAYSIEINVSEDSNYVSFYKEGYREDAAAFYIRDGKFVFEDSSFDKCTDSEKTILRFDSKEDLSQFQVNSFLYPFSKVFIYWDEPVIAELTYEYKNCRGRGFAGNDNLDKEHSLGSALPLSYDAELRLVTEGDKEYITNLYNDQFGKHVKVYKRFGKIVSKTCEDGSFINSCISPKKELIFFSIVIGVILVFLLGLIFMIWRIMKLIKKSSYRQEC